mmetsp:Transcript_71035/g.190550  ORF Transcript_71035/g.190550 Transcript_71035/m.190550 type:complete len:216 (-) Transcript_71035:51-698(-)
MRETIGYHSCVALAARHIQHMPRPQRRRGPEPAPRPPSPGLLAAREVGQEPVAVQEVAVELGRVHGEGGPVELEVVAELVSLRDGPPHQLPQLLPQLRVAGAALAGLGVEARHDQEGGAHAVVAKHVQQLLEVRRRVQQWHVVQRQCCTPLRDRDAPHHPGLRLLEVHDGPVGQEIGHDGDQHGEDHQHERQHGVVHAALGVPHPGRQHSCGAHG